MSRGSRQCGRGVTVQRCGSGGCTRVGIPGWVYRGSTSPARCPGRTQKQTSEAGPGRPTGPGVGGSAGPGALGDGGGGGISPPCGPGQSSPREAFPGIYLRNAASWPIGARFTSFYCKVSQNGQVSPKKCKKACHSPYFQNGLEKSPLGFLRFPFSPAFSRKELLGLF